MQIVHDDRRGLCEGVVQRLNLRVLVEVDAIKVNAIGAVGVKQLFTGVYPSLQLCKLCAAIDELTAGGRSCRQCFQLLLERALRRRYPAPEQDLLGSLGVRPLLSGELLLEVFEDVKKVRAPEPLVAVGEHGETDEDFRVREFAVAAWRVLACEWYRQELARGAEIEISRVATCRFGRFPALDVGLMNHPVAHPINLGHGMG